MKKIRLLIITLFVIPALFAGLMGCAAKPAAQKLPVRVLILPKFEVNEITGDFPGEAQFFYDEYLAGGEEYIITGCPDTWNVYYKDGIALCLTGQGKVSAALTVSAILSDERFDFSDAYILSVGCCGSAEGQGIPGDLYVVTASVDFDLGHRADAREISDPTGTTWFHDRTFDDTAFIRYDEGLADRVFEMVKNVPMETTERTTRFLETEYAGQEWANRKPEVMFGTSVTGDSFWKGKYEHQNALLITETYQCRDPYRVTEMEDLAVGKAAERFGMLDRLIDLRVSVNMDAFPAGVTPEMLWGPESDNHVAQEESTESIDIFETAMKNLFAAGKVVIDELLKE